MILSLAAHDDRHLEIAESTGTVHLANVKDQFVIEKTLTPP